MARLHLVRQHPRRTATGVVVVGTHTRNRAVGHDQPGYNPVARARDVLEAEHPVIVAIRNNGSLGYDLFVDDRKTKQLMAVVTIYNSKGEHAKFSTSGPYSDRFRATLERHGFRRLDPQAIFNRSGDQNRSTVNPTSHEGGTNITAIHKIVVGEHTFHVTEFTSPHFFSIGAPLSISPSTFAMKARQKGTLDAYPYSGIGAIRPDGSMNVWTPATGGRLFPKDVKQVYLEEVRDRLRQMGLVR